jgi:hypothetical protein
MRFNDKWNYQDVWLTEFKGWLRFAGFLLILLAVFVSNVFATDIKSVQNGNWSDTNTWNTGTVPEQGDNVLIDSSHVVIYDVFSDKEIRLIHIRGTLEFSRSFNTRLDVGMIIISTAEIVNVNANCSMHHHGPFWPEAPRPALEIGTMANPIPANITARIRLKYFSDMSDDCAPGIISYGGRMDVHGAPVNRTWGKLGAGTPQGATTITLAEAVDWKVGDHIIITRSTRPEGNIHNSGSFRTNGQSETEEKYIAAISGNTITLDSPLEHAHPKWWGNRTGEVALLSRNVIVESKDPGGERGHTMYHRGSVGSISYAEFAHLGKAGVLARYPIHYHVLGSSMRGSSVVGASIWDSHNRFVTIHATNYLVVRDCVGYKSLGHGFFMENGEEVYNFLDHNLSVLTFDTDELPDQALPYDSNDGAGFWWANGRNAFLNNVAAETDRYGYQYEIFPEFSAPVEQPDGSIRQNVQIRSLPFILFKNNEAHGTMEYGMALEGGSAAVDDPFIIENFSMWSSWRAIRPDLNYFWIKNLHFWNVAYGFYAFHPKNGRVEGFHAIRTGNYAMSFKDTPEGLITFEDVEIDTSSEYPFRIYGQDPRQSNCDIHVRNYTVNNVENGWKGAAANSPIQHHPDLTLFLHDWFGPGQDAKVIPAIQNRNDGLNYQNLSPIFRNDVKVAATGVSFPNNPVHLNDNLPPATVIIYPPSLQEFSSQTGQISVTGTCIDASNITSVTVNGVPATPLAENYTRWQATLTNLPQGMVTIESRATDEFGNVELNPHRITVGIGITPTGTSNGNEITVLPQNFELGDNFPNPFNPETNIRFTVSNDDRVNSNVQVIIYDVLGHRVRELVSGSLPPGEYTRTWDGRDDNGNPMASGVYIYEMIARNGRRSSFFKQAKKMLLLR